MISIYVTLSCPQINLKGCLHGEGNKYFSKNSGYKKNLARFVSGKSFRIHAGIGKTIHFYMSQPAEKPPLHSCFPIFYAEEATNVYKEVFS